MRKRLICATGYDRVTPFYGGCRRVGRQIEAVVCLGGCNLTSSGLIQVRLEPVKTLHRLTTPAWFVDFTPFGPYVRQFGSQLKAVDACCHKMKEPLSYHE